MTIFFLNVGKIHNFEVSVSSRNFNQVSVSKVTVSTTSLNVIFSFYIFIAVVSVIPFVCCRIYFSKPQLINNSLWVHSRSLFEKCKIHGKV